MFSRENKRGNYVNTRPLRTQLGERRGVFCQSLRTPLPSSLSHHSGKLITFFNYTQPGSHLFWRFILQVLEKFSVIRLFTQGLPPRTPRAGAGQGQWENAIRDRQLDALAPS